MRRNDIIDAAEKLFFDKGYDSTTIDDVAKTAEFSKRTVYVYFNSKEQLYFEIMLRGYKLLNRMMADEFQRDAPRSALDGIRRIGDALYRFSREYPNYFNAILEYENGERDFDKSVPDRSREECYEQGEIVLGHLVRLLNQGMEEGTVRPDIDAAGTALVLWACTVGVFKTARTKARYIGHYHNSSADRLIADAFDLLIRSIRVTPEGE
ncbi:TetR/AcrR family transcriptional regulator [Paenibacillus flagellatus]|nr:TetR/AcrR family transcriptional regulator [Paenibacillus flagellatus]